MALIDQVKLDENGEIQVDNLYERAYQNLL